jgi:hypothetical protein
LHPCVAHQRMPRTASATIDVDQEARALLALRVLC